jgi:glycosyltransferase involved in cell wall biosynthesis
MRVLLVSIAPPQNDCGVRVVLHRHLVERNPFELRVVTNADYYTGQPAGEKISLPRLLARLRKTRFGPQLAPWLTDYENLIWPLAVPSALDRAISDFQPDVILTMAETGLCHLAAKAAKKHRLPLAGLFLDWFPVMQGHFGAKWTQNLLSRRYREFYRRCDLAFCTSDGMQDVLGAHPNSHVIYPMPARHRVPEKISPPKNGKFRLVYVGSVQNFYGRMICSAIEKFSATADLEIIVVGPNADWPAEILERAKSKGIYLGFKPPEEAATVLAGADALLVVMSFEPQHRLFMETSFTTKFLDYTAFAKPIILWGPEYCTPVRVVRRDGGALLAGTPDADEVVTACRKIAGDHALREKLSAEAKRLNENLFNPDRLQNIFVGEIEKLAAKK